MIKKEEENHLFAGLYLNNYEISKRSTEDLKRILGNFEKEYNESARSNLEIVGNEILGWVTQGTVDYALKIKAITKYSEIIYGGREVYYVHLPEYYEYGTKHRILRELIGRRDYAQNMNKVPDFSSVVKSIS